MSRMIEIDDDIYELLVSNIQEFGEDVSGVLRRLLKDDPEANQASAQGVSDPLLTFLDGLLFKVERNITDRFLSILAFVHDQDPAAFEQVLQIRGRKRVYFARSNDEIEKSGKSTFPREIPGTAYSVMTNTDTGQKKDMLKRVLQMLGYSESVILRTKNALER